MPKILIIDSSDNVQSFTKIILNDAGFETIEATSGDEGLEYAEKDHPDCILFNFLMPKIDGYDLLYRLNLHTSATPILIFSSELEDNVRLRCSELGASGFIDSPPGSQALLQKIKTVLDLKEQSVKLVLTSKQNNALKELLSTGIDKGVEILNAILATNVNIEIPFINILSQKNFESYVKNNPEDQHASVNISFCGDISGSIGLVFPKESAVNLVAALSGEEPQKIIMDSMRSGTLSEIITIVSNSIIGSIGNLLDFKLYYKSPVYIEGSYEKLSMSARTEKNSIILQARARFSIDMLAVTGDIMLFLELNSLDKIISIIENMEYEV